MSPPVHPFPVPPSMFGIAMPKAFIRALPTICPPLPEKANHRPFHRDNRRQCWSKTERFRNLEEVFRRGDLRGFGFGPRHIGKPDNRFTFLRGVQLTGPTGLAQVDTTVPGWYAGRTTHIHVRVHNGGLVVDSRYRPEGHISHTGQIFLPEDITDHIYQSRPLTPESRRTVYL